MLWRRKLIVVLAIIVAVGASVLYLKKNHPTYKSDAIVQISPLPQGAQGSGVVVDMSLRYVTGPEVSAAAVKLLDVPSPSAIGAVVTATQSSTATSASTTDTTADVTITAASASPSRAQKVADAFANAYVQQLDKQAQSNIAAWQRQLDQAAQKLQQLGQQQNSTNPNPLVSAEIQSTQGLWSAANSALAAAQHAPTIGAVVNEASPGVSSRSSHKILFIALVIGVLGGCGLALAREQLDTRVRRSDDLETSGDVPLLAELPVDPDGRSNDRALPVLDKPHSSFPQAIRELRTSLQVLLPDATCQVMVVTSPEPSDGKTFVASNLAVSWALAGKRTLVIAADLRRDHIDEVFSSTIPGVGLADYLAGGLVRSLGGKEASPAIDELLWQTDVDGLLLLPAGTSSRDPGDLLASPRMADLLVALRNEFDVILIDTPPTLAVADSAILSSLVDGVVVVVNAQGTSGGNLDRTVRRLSSAGGTVLGLVFNRSREAVKLGYESYYSPNQRPVPSAKADRAPLRTTRLASRPAEGDDVEQDSPEPVDHDALEAAGDADAVDDGGAPEREMSLVAVTANGHSHNGHSHNGHSHGAGDAADGGVVATDAPAD